MYNVFLVGPEEENSWNEIMSSSHPLGNPKIAGHRIKYWVKYKKKVIALACFSSCAYQLADRDRWIGWTAEQSTCRRHFIVQNSRFLTLPHEGDHVYNLASRVLGSCARQLSFDWNERFGHPVLLLETFTDPVTHKGTCYKASGWEMVGKTKGFRRDSQEFYSKDSSPKNIWMKKLNPDACEILRAEKLPDELKIHEKSLPAKTVARRVGTEGMRSLFTAFKKLPDSRRGEGKRYSIPCCFSIILCAVLAGCKGVRECAEFANSLSQPQLRALKSWRNKQNGKFMAPTATTLWRVAEAMDPIAFETVANEWFRNENIDPEAIAIDGKTLRGTLLNENGGDCAVSAVSHDNKDFFLSKFSLLQKEKK